MAFNFLLGREIREDQVLPGFFFYGEETYLAAEFVRQLREALISPDSQGFNLERFDLEDSRWPDIIDLARTVPFFFSPWRIIVVEIAEGTRDKLSALEEKILKDYFRSPSPRTVVVVILFGRVKKAHPLVKFFSSFAPSTVFVKEIKPLKGGFLYSWMERKLEALGKRATPEAETRLEEIIGSDLRRIENELDKIADYMGERKVVDVEDVNQVCGWVRSFIEWELANSLEKADYEQALLVLNQSFREGERPEYITGIMANLFRDALLAKIWLRENRGKKEIFADLRPQILEKFGGLYTGRFRDFFSLVEGLSREDLSLTIRELQAIDAAIKTSDASPQVLLETFVFKYCNRRKQKRAGPGLTRKERG